MAPQALCSISKCEPGRAYVNLPPEEYQCPYCIHRVCLTIHTVNASKRNLPIYHAIPTSSCANEGQWPQIPEFTVSMPPLFFTRQADSIHSHTSHQAQAFRTAQDGAGATTACKVDNDTTNNVGYTANTTVGPVQSFPSAASYRDAHRCPYHGPLLQLQPEDKGAGKSASPMERFLTKTPGSEAAVFLRWDSGQLSTRKGCVCRLGLGNPLG